MTGIPIRVAMSAGIEIPEKPERPIIMPERLLKGLLKKMPAAIAITVAIMPMISCSMTHAKRSSFAV